MTDCNTHQSVSRLKTFYRATDRLLNIKGAK
jgi:hypothetical protein